jgi:hypothetical protein
VFDFDPRLYYILNTNLSLVNFKSFNTLKRNFGITNMPTRGPSAQSALIFPILVQPADIFREEFACSARFVKNTPEKVWTKLRVL